MMAMTTSNSISVKPCRFRMTFSRPRIDGDSFGIVAPWERIRNRAGEKARKPRSGVPYFVAPPLVADPLQPASILRIIYGLPPCEGARLLPCAFRVPAG